MQGMPFTAAAVVVWMCTPLSVVQCQCTATDSQVHLNALQERRHASELELQRTEAAVRQAALAERLEGSSAAAARCGTLEVQLASSRREAEDAAAQVRV